MEKEKRTLWFDNQLFLSLEVITDYQLAAWAKYCMSSQWNHGVHTLWHKTNMKPNTVYAKPRTGGLRCRWLNLSQVTLLRPIYRVLRYQPAESLKDTIPTPGHHSLFILQQRVNSTVSDAKMQLKEQTTIPFWQLCLFLQVFCLSHNPQLSLSLLFSINW